MQECWFNILKNFLKALLLAMTDVLDVQIIGTAFSTNLHMP